MFDGMPLGNCTQGAGEGAIGYFGLQTAGHPPNASTRRAWLLTGRNPRRNVLGYPARKDTGPPVHRLLELCLYAAYAPGFTTGVTLGSAVHNSYKPGNVTT